MGAGSSVSVDVANTALTETAISVTNACRAKAMNEYTFKFGNVKGDFIVGNEDASKAALLTQMADSSLNCKNKTDIEAAMKSAMESSLKAQAEAQQQSIFEGSMSIYTESRTNMRARNKSIMRANLDVLQDCTAKSTNILKYDAGNVDGNVIINQPVDQNVRTKIIDCINEAALDTDFSQHMKTEAEGSASVKGLFATMFDGLGNSIAGLIAIFLVIGVVGFIGYMLFKYYKNNSSSDDVAVDQGFYNPYNQYTVV